MPRKSNHFEDKAKAIDRFVQELSTLNREIAIESINFFKESFDNQGFTNTTLIPWRRTKAGKKNTFGQKSSGILIQSGELKDSFDYEINGMVITIINTAAHAPAHNEGLTIKHPGGTAYFTSKGKTRFISNRKAKEIEKKALAGLKLPRTKAHPIPMPKRQFMGKSVVLNERIRKIIIQKFIRAIYG